MSTWCPNCGRHVALVPTDRPGVMVAVDFDQTRYTPSGVRHSCPVAS